VSAAEQELRRALELDPDDPLLRETLAGTLLESAVTREAVEEAHRAAALGLRLGEARPNGLIRILDHGADREAVRAILRELLAEDPGRVDTRFALAASLDTDHRIVEAEREYRGVLERDPEHAMAMVYLAYLVSGADCERCGDCARVFASSPQVVDVAESGRLLARAAALDRGRDGSLLTSIVEIAKSRGLVEPVQAALEPLSESGERTARGMRIEDALRRLRQAE
jgi:predicted Zn-dependent protease